MKLYDDDDEEIPCRLRNVLLSDFDEGVDYTKLVKSHLTFPPGHYTLDGILDELVKKIESLEKECEDHQSTIEDLTLQVKDLEEQLEIADARR